MPSSAYPQRVHSFLFVNQVPHLRTPASADARIVRFLRTGTRRIMARRINSTNRPDTSTQTFFL